MEINVATAVFQDMIFYQNGAGMSQEVRING